MDTGPVLDSRGFMLLEWVLDVNISPCLAAT
jgi:hypothetical protein